MTKPKNMKIFRNQESPKITHSYFDIILLFIVSFGLQYGLLLSPCLCYYSKRKIEGYFPFVIFLCVSVAVRFFIAVYQKDKRAVKFYHFFYGTAFLWISILYHILWYIRDGKLYL